MIGYACFVKDRITYKHILALAYPVVTPQFVGQTLVSPHTASINLDVDTRDIFGAPIPYLYVSTDRQDYVFKVTFTKWEIVKKVAVVFDVQNWKNNVNSSCQEEKDSDVQILTCWIDFQAPSTAIIWIVPIPTTNTQTLIFSTNY